MRNGSRIPGGMYQPESSRTGRAAGGPGPPERGRGPAAGKIERVLRVAHAAARGARSAARCPSARMKPAISASTTMTGGGAPTADVGGMASCERRERRVPSRDDGRELRRGGAAARPAQASVGGKCLKARVELLDQPPPRPLDQRSRANVERASAENSLATSAASSALVGGGGDRRARCSRPGGRPRPRPAAPSASNRRRAARRRGSRPPGTRSARRRSGRCGPDRPSRGSAAARRRPGPRAAPASRAGRRWPRSCDRARARNATLAPTAASVISGDDPRDAPGSRPEIGGKRALLLRAADCSKGRFTVLAV